MVVKVGGTLYSVSNVAFTLTNELYDEENVTSSGTQDLLRVKRMVTGSFSLLYDNNAIETAFQSGTTAELIIVSSQGDQNLTKGNTFGIRFPLIRYTAVPKSEDAGIFKYDVTFKAALTNGEDEIWSASFC
jgi:hypothetical protein